MAMSVGTIRYIQTIPPEGLDFGLRSGLEINSFVPLGEGSIFIKPASPLEGQSIEEITIGALLVGAAFPGAGATRLEAGSTAVPLLVTIAPTGTPMQAVMVATSSSSGGGGLPAGAATEGKQDDQITQFATLISNTTGAALDATVVQVKEAIDALKGNGVDNATHYDILFEMQTRGAVDTDHLVNIEAASSDSAIKLDSILSSSQNLETYTDDLEGILAQVRDKIIAAPATESKQNAIKLAIELLSLVSAPPTLWKKYTTVPSGGIDLSAVYPGSTPVRVETYGDGVLAMKPLGDPMAVVTVDSFYGWTWTLSPQTIEDTTTALPLLVYWS